MRTPGTEVPARADRIREALDAAGARLIEADPAAADALLAVHDPELLEYLAGAWEDWRRSGLTADPGQDRVVPYLFAHPGLVGELPLRDPAAAVGASGPLRLRHDDPDRPRHLGGGAGRRPAPHSPPPIWSLAGEPAAYACCRPPGHHATRGAFGGSCYLNNAAAGGGQAAGRRQRPGRGDRHRRPPRQRHPVDLLRRSRACSPARSTSIRGPAGSPTSSASPRRRARARARAPTATCRSPPAPATDRGSRRSPTSPPGRSARGARAWSSRSASTPPRATRRARSR